MSLTIIDNISKSYGNKVLYENVSFTIEPEDKIGIIGVNGTGKSTLLKIIAGVDTCDSGTVSSSKGLKIEYLAQDPELNGNNTIIEEVFQSDTPLNRLIRLYEETTKLLEKNPNDKGLQKQMLDLNDKMNHEDAWNLESQVKTILTKLGASDFEAKVSTLSGGQKKRVALAKALISPCDLLILDEPTNHMDNKTIDWLEKFLLGRKGAMIMITHDRYFLDRVVNRIIELDYGSLFQYTGGYSEYVEKKSERLDMQKTKESKRLNLFKKELAWIRAGVQGRGTKQKARIQRFNDIKSSKVVNSEDSVEIDFGFTRLGKKTIELKNISKSYDTNEVIKDFSYLFLKDDRIGIIGDNGAGKTTLLNIISGIIQPSQGELEIGDTVKVGYFSQHVDDMTETISAIEYLRTFAEYIEDSKGNKISMGQMMEKFLFPRDTQNTPLYKMSGGEKRRLALLRMLIEQPNVLVFDEPTNDLDIDTLKTLESYIDDFDGIVVTVSHDRYFLDRVCNKIISIENNKDIYIHNGNYADFIEYKDNNIQIDQEEIKKKVDSREKTKKIKLSYNEKRELETIVTEIEALELRIDEIHNEMSNNPTDFVLLDNLNKEIESTEELLLEKMERFEYLSELEEG